MVPAWSFGVPEHAYGLMFHHFVPGDAPGREGALCAAQLEQLLEEFGGRLLPAKEWLDRAERDSLRPGDVCLTFDDNLRCQFDVARPALSRRELTGVWFVSSGPLVGEPIATEIYRALRMHCFPTTDAFYAAFEAVAARSEFGTLIASRLTTFVPRDFLTQFTFYTDADRRFRHIRDEILGPTRFAQLMDRLIAECGVSTGDLAAELWMQPEQLRQLQREGHVIGLHSHRHPTRMAYLDESRQYEEYAANRDVLRVCLGAAPTVAAHPCNSYNAATLRVLRALGVRIAFRADCNAAPSDLEQPREDAAHLVRTPTSAVVASSS